MSSFDICNFEEFIAEVTAQPGSLEEAASTQEILAQQLEGFFNRLQVAICSDVTNLQTQITAIVPQSLPDLVAGVEVSSGREVLGAPSFYKLIDLGGLPVAAKTVAHGIARPFRCTFMHGAANDPTGAAEATLPLGHASQGINNLTDVAIFITTTLINVTNGIDRSAFTQAYVVLEYIKS